MIKKSKAVLAASTALALLTFPGFAANSAAAPVVLAQAGDAPSDTSLDPVAAAEKAVEEARAALRAAMASGRGVEEARRDLRTALQALDDARRNAGQPSSPATPPADQPPPPAQLPSDQIPPPPETATPPAPPEPAVPSVDQATPTPATPEQPPQSTEPQTTEPPTSEPQTPPVPEQPPSADKTNQPPVTAEPPPPPSAPPPPTDQQPATPPAAEMPKTTTPPGPPPAVELPPPSVTEPPPPPPPAATEGGAIDLGKFRERPKFGQATQPEAATPPPALQQSEDAVKEGTVIQAPEGRVIVKDRGQITVLHDDSGRLRQRGDKVDTRTSGGDTETTTVQRPDGTSIVTVRDKYGNIVQRYREKPDGTVEVMIGAVDQPGFLGRMLGRGPQMAPPPRDYRPPQLDLRLGPLQLSIPRDQYIVESSRADAHTLEQTLMAPPVERIERPYTLEEIQRIGRIRDKVRRIDFDSITFDTNQATVADNQIPTLQDVATAIRDIVNRDSTQVFLIEGHTDAVGSDLYNLALSDRRAETVAQILTYYYGVPPENLITQGYGEQFLKVPTTAPERENRRVAFRNITPLLRAAGQ